MSHRTIRVRTQGPACFIGFDRRAERNAVDTRMLDELGDALDALDASCSILVLEGDDDFFCFGADLDELTAVPPTPLDPDRLYALWERIAFGPRITIAHVRGQVNAGGVGFVAASDIVVAHPRASFALSELLFGLQPACVLPFLIRRIGEQRASRMALTTLPVTAEQAQTWGLVDLVDEVSESLLRKLLLRLRHVPVDAIAAHKRYMQEADHTVRALRARAVAANREVFSDAQTLLRIRRFLNTGLFPWEKDLPGGDAGPA